MTSFRRRCTPADFATTATRPACRCWCTKGTWTPSPTRQNQIFEAAITFAKAQGIIPAPEPSHAIKGAIDEALAAKEAGEERVILFNLCGHGHFDMQAYDDYLHGRLPEVEFDEADEDAALAALPEVSIQV